ncbi:PREDICTED: protein DETOXIFICATION 56-like [Ipomoea nil]|uniref:protein DETOXIFICATION 56-like n=1 Tax=Ipomoea nil TaxID=35883 RepID=UPI000900F896|nr:PREDICTED: protein DETOXIFICATION 56-like [Ipomoea nil]
MNIASRLEEDRPVSPTTLSSPKTWSESLVKPTLSELKVQRPILLPLLLMNITWFAKITITTVFLGRLGELSLSGATLGFTFANVTGFSVLTGLNFALEPICGQAFGAKNFRLLHKTLVMAASLLLIISLPIALLWINVDKILLRFGQQEDVSIMAKEYVVHLLPDLVITSFLSPLKIYLTAQNVTVPIMAATALAIGLHVPLNVFLSKSMGVRGVSMAFWVTDLMILVMLCIYVVIKENMKGGKWKEGGWWEQSGGDWIRMVKLAGPCCLTTCLEWWCYEIIVLLAGNLPDAKEALGVIAIVLNFDYLLCSVMLSLATCASVRVANELGANSAAAARASAYVSLGLAAVSGVLGGAAMAGARGFWGALFTHEKGIIVGVKRTMLIVAVMEVMNFSVLVSGGIARGTARPWLGTYASVCGFYLLALPLGVILAFKVHLGLAGLLTGLAAGVAVCLLILLAFIARINWEEESRKAQILASRAIDEATNNDDQ